MAVEFDYHIEMTAWVDGQCSDIQLMVFVKNFIDRFYELSGSWSGVLRNKGADVVFKDRIKSAVYYPEQKKTKVVMITNPYMLGKPKKLYRNQDNFLYYVEGDFVNGVSLQDVSSMLSCYMTVESVGVYDDNSPYENVVFSSGRILSVSFDVLGNKAIANMLDGCVLMKDVIVDDYTIQKKMYTDDMEQSAGPGYDFIRHLKESGFTVE